MRASGPAWVVVIFGLVVAACGPAATQPSPSSASQAPVAKQRLVASIFADPSGLDQEMTTPNPGTGSVPGLTEAFAMLDGALTYVDEKNGLHPWLAEAVPSVENGLWKVLPDGGMETTWHLKPGITWHDGTPLTADDLRFTLEVYRDRDTGIPNLRGIALIEGIDAPDPQTAVVRWRQPFIDADRLFNNGTTMWMLPRHVLEAPFQGNKENFLSDAYWREGFIGAGPFTMQEWTSGSRMMLAANEHYVLGRPQIDHIEVQFIRDRGALVAALLSGTIQLPIGRGLYLEQATQIHDATQDVKVQLGGVLGGVLPVYPQLLTPDPAIIGNVQFRRALLMAIDRQEMTDTLNQSLGPVAHSWVQPDRAEGKAIDGNIVRYDYNLRAATQLIEELGYTKGPDGNVRDPTGAKLSVQIMTHSQNALHVPAALSVAGYWQRLGVDVQMDVASPASAQDRKWRALYPGFSVLSKGVLQPDGLFNSGAIPTEDHNFVGSNVARYGSPDLDDLIQRYITTIPFPDRMKVLGEMVHLQTDRVTMLPLFFQGQGIVLGSARLENVLPQQVWNAHQWKLT